MDYEQVLNCLEFEAEPDYTFIKSRQAGFTALTLKPSLLALWNTNPRMFISQYRGGIELKNIR